MAGKAPREFLTRERCYISELVNDPAWPELSVARARVEPGVTTELHALSVAEWYVVESGSGLMYVGESKPCPVGPGHVVTIPKHESQKVTNSGSHDLVFLCVCAPRFSVNCYTPLE